MRRTFFPLVQGAQIPEYADTFGLAEGQTEKTSDPSVYLLTRDQMTEQAYPVPSPAPDSPINSPTFEDWKRPDGWIEAPYLKPNGGQRKVLGLDCEMVSGAASGHRLQGSVELTLVTYE